MKRVSAAFAASRFGLGLRPARDDIFGRDPVAALIGEAESQSQRPSDGDLATSQEIITNTQAYMVARRQAAKAVKAGQDAPSMMADQAAAMRSGPEDTGDKMKPAMADAPRPQPPHLAYYNAEFEALIARSKTAPIGFFERLVSFWSNHFAVEANRNFSTRGTVGAFEREAIRPHVLGRFDEMLFAVSNHPTMLYYLDNFLSAGVNSRVGQRGRFGLNENYGREMLELHTLGVDGGYDQDDVRALANALSGWSVVRNPQRADFGTFTFFKTMHEPGPVTVLGKTYPQRGEDQASAIIADLARHPATAHHLAFKLVQAFVADTPPKDLVGRLAKVYMTTGGDLSALTWALVTDQASWEAPRTKLRTPQEFIWASIRALPVETSFEDIRRGLTILGQLPWSPISPAGYPGDSRTWLAADALTNRLDYAQFLATRTQPHDPRLTAEAALGDLLSGPTLEAIERAESPQQAYALLLMSPEFQRR